MSFRLKNIILLFMAIILTYNCSTTPDYVKFPDNASPTEELSYLEDELKEARKNQVYLLSPDNYELSYKNYEKAQESIQKRKSAENSLKYIAISRVYLERSLSYAQTSRQNLIQVVRAREQAIKANAETYALKDLEKADNDLVSKTKKIERNKISDATKDSRDLQEEYLRIELFSIKSANLNPASKTIELAIEEGAREFAPRSLATVQKELNDFDAYLTANRHEDRDIRRKFNSIQARTKQLLKITRDSKSNKGMTSEDIALRDQDNMDMIATKQSQIEQDESQLRAMSARNTQHQADEKANALFEAARKEFKSDEADVYKQGNTLSIRLKGLNFPSSTAEIKNENYELLSKVQRVINTFEPSKIVIEGHTDSVGGKEVNEALSLNRAESVKRYLMTNSKGKSLNIEAVGLDYQKPLASNKTATGRAQNRRVDVKIMTDQN